MFIRNHEKSRLEFVAKVAFADIGEIICKVVLMAFDFRASCDHDEEGIKGPRDLNPGLHDFPKPCDMLCCDIAVICSVLIC